MKLLYVHFETPEKTPIVLAKCIAENVLLPAVPAKKKNEPARAHPRVVRELQRAAELVGGRVIRAARNGDGAFEEDARGSGEHLDRGHVGRRGSEA